MKKLLLLLCLMVGSVAANPDKYLLESISKNSFVNVRFALEAGANPNIIYNNRKYLTWAFDWKNHDLISLLMDHGAMIIEEDLKIMHRDRSYWIPCFYNSYQQSKQLNIFYARLLPFLSHDWDENHPLVVEVRNINKNIK